jgi:hypothetical protein
LLNFVLAILNAALVTSASKSTIVGLFPPNSNIQGTRFSEAALATFLPINDPPVKKIKSHGNEQI